MRYLRWLLFPFSLVYGLVVVVRNWFYDCAILKSQSFDLPVVSIGNLDVGGAGKTPMTEYLIKLLKPGYRLATLSRGYGRKTSGYRLVETKSMASETGDEPLQMKRKFSDITVAVCEDRVAGIHQLQSLQPELILLDDAYQHRAVKPGFSILLFSYDQLQQPALLLPAGNRREPFNGRKRADVMVVSKCPPGMDMAEQVRLRKKLNPYPHQQVFFTGIGYQGIKDKEGRESTISLDADTVVFLLTGIAWPGPLVNHIRQSGAKVIHHKYPDHHPYSLKNIAKLADDFKACAADKKVIVTTEKDMQRLEERELAELTQMLPIYTMPIAVHFLNDEEAAFNELIENYVRKYTEHRGVH